MRALRFLGASQAEITKLPEPSPGPGEVLVQITCSALCGSELKAYRGEQALAANPGHEAVGRVIATNGTQRVAVGDRVGIHAVWGCGRCAQCQTGRYTFCDDRRPSPPMHAERVAAPEHVLIPLADDVPDSAAVLLSGDGLGVPYHVGKRLSTRGGDLVCIVGAGPIGLGHALMQRFLGAEVVVIEKNPYRLELAQDLGANHVINPEAVDPVAALKAISRGELAAACLECVGSPPTLALALRLVGKSGTVVAVGEQGDVTVNVGRDLIRRDITLMGSWYYHYAEYPELLRLYRRGLQAERLVTHRFPFEAGPQAFAEFSAGRTGKVLLTYG